MDRLPARHSRAATRLAEILQEAVDMLEDADLLEDDGLHVPPDSSLVQQCIELTRAASTDDEPIRTLHHFACTGGTVISQCVAAMPNVQLLSEVDPLSPMGPSAKQTAFLPTDMSALLKHGTRPVSRDLLVELFRAELGVAYREAGIQGNYLVIRDHSHSHFCTGDRIPERPSVRELVEKVAPALSLVTVRDPLDSFAALQVNKWVGFQPSTFEEYCVRYLAFLDRHRGIPVMRYEDFVREPQKEMARACDALQLPYFDGFASLYSVFPLSGGSGRKFAEIRETPSRPERRELLPAAAASPHYRELAGRLGYSPEPA